MKETMPNQEILQNPEQKIEKVQISKEQFAEMVYRNGERISSVLDSDFLGHTYIRKEEFKETAQATYEFNGSVYLVEFDVELGQEQKQMGYSLNLWGYNLTPKNIKLVEFPAIDKVK